MMAIRYDGRNCGHGERGKTKTSEEAAAAAEEWRGKTTSERDTERG